MSTQYDPRETADSLMDKRLSEKDKQFIEYLYLEQGYTTSRVAQETGHDVRWIMRYLKKSGLRDRKREQQAVEKAEFWAKRQDAIADRDAAISRLADMAEEQRGDSTEGKKAERLLTEDVREQTKPWKHFRNRIVHTKGNPHFWVNFGRVNDCELGSKNITVWNEKKERLQFSKKRLFGNEQDQDQDNLNLQWNVLQQKVLSMMDEDVAVALDATVYLKPTYITDITSLEQLPTKPPAFHRYAGSDVQIDEYKNHQAYLKKIREEKMVPHEPTIRPSRSRRIGPEERLGSLLGGKALSVNEIVELKEELTKKLASFTATKALIEEKYKIEISRADESLMKARNSYERAMTEVDHHKKRLDDITTHISGVKHDLTREAGKVEAHIKEVQDQIADVIRVEDQIKKWVRGPRKEPLSPRAANRFAREALLREAKAEKAEQEKVAANIKMSMGHEQPDLMNMLTDAQMETLADLIAARMAPQQQPPEERMYTQAEMDAVTAQVRAAQDRERQANLLRAADRRLYQTTAELDSLREDVEAERRENEDTNQRTYNRAVSILAEKGDDIYEGSHRIRINSPKVRMNLALRTGIPNVAGALSVEIKEPFTTHDDQEQTNAFYCEIPDFGKTCIIAIVYPDNSRDDMVAASIMSDRDGWMKAEKKIVGKYLGRQGKSRTDVSPQEWAELHQQIEDSLDFQDVDLAG
jgi:predicted GIY-YIG superfamily endonuclease